MVAITEKWSWERPSEKLVALAAQVKLRDEKGNSFTFGSILPTQYASTAAKSRPYSLDQSVADVTKARNGGARAPITRLVCFFVGHWWCGLCQGFVQHSINNLDPKDVEASGLRIVLIGCAGWEAISKYRKRFDIKFPIYTDVTGEIYKHFGMSVALPNIVAEMKRKNRPGYHQNTFAKQMTLGMVVSRSEDWGGRRDTDSQNGIRMGLSGGNMMQQGGEFAFSAGYKCEFAHRMVNRSGEYTILGNLDAMLTCQTTARPLTSSKWCSKGSACHSSCGRLRSLLLGACTSKGARQVSLSILSLSISISLALSLLGLGLQCQ
jgi:hypothetical protein